MTEYSFDNNGRCIAKNLKAPYHHQTRNYFKFGETTSVAEDSFDRIKKAFNYTGPLTSDVFKNKVSDLNLHLKKHFDGIQNGPRLPFFIPKNDYSNTENALSKHMLPALEKSYAAMFPDYEFKNHVPSTALTGLQVSQYSRHDRLINQSKDNDVIGLYIPCLSEYSIPACKELILNLPDEYSLGGAIDTTCALIGTPNLLYNKEAYPPLLWLAAIDTPTPTASYHFEAYGYNLTFNRKVHLNQVAEFWCSGFTIIAS